MKQPPEIVMPKAIEMPRVETVTLPGGMPVHLIQQPHQDVVRVSFVWSAGSAVQTKPFSASATLNLLAEGSEKYSSRQIAEKLDFVGSYFDVTIDRDYAVATFCCLEKFFAPTLEMIEQIVLHPVFPAEEVSSYTQKRMERLAVERSKPSTKARELFAEALFGDTHPYGISSPESEYPNLTRDDVADFYRLRYGSDNCFVVASMGSDPARREALLSLLSHLPKSGAREEVAMPAAVSDRRRDLPIEGAVQSAIRVGRVLFPRTHPDFVEMQVVATVLGGYFGSRLVRNLREERGYTYGVMAAMVNLKESGYLAIATEVAAATTADTIEQIFAEMERLTREPVGEDELDTVRRSMLGEVMRILDGPFGVVDVVIENVQVGCGGSEAYVNDFIGRINSITPEHIMTLARKYLNRESFTTVVVGKPA